MQLAWVNNGSHQAASLEGALSEQSELERILRKELLYPHFQPIMCLETGSLLGHEALIRGPWNSPLHSPAALFRVAIKQGCQLELELLCRKLTLQQFARLGLEGVLFLNVTASLLSSPDHQRGFTRDLLHQLGIPVENIVIELSEQHPFDQHGLTRAAVDHYRSMGFRIAIDDLGSGYSGLKLWSELQPEFVKIDKHFIRGLHRDPVKREFVRSISQIGRSLGCCILAEGLEDEAELHSLQALGVELGQGFLLGRPELHPRPLLTPEQLRPSLACRARRFLRRRWYG